jgi:hypothetical protein
MDERCFILFFVSANTADIKNFRHYFAVSFFFRTFAPNHWHDGLSGVLPV